MSWHGYHHPERPDPFARPAKPGDAIGFYVVVRMVAPDRQAGLRAIVRCTRCRQERTAVLTQLRHSMEKKRQRNHKGCARPVPHERKP